MVEDGVAGNLEQRLWVLRIVSKSKRYIIVIPMEKL